MSSVIAAKASVILAFKFVISGTGVENNMSLTYPPTKRSQGGWYPAIVVARVSDHLSQSTCLENVASKNRRTCEPQCGGAPSCWKIIHGWNSSEVQRKVPTWFLVKKVCNQGKTLCSPCSAMWSGNCYPTVQRNVLPSSSRLWVDEFTQDLENEDVT